MKRAELVFKAGVLAPVRMCDCGELAADVSEEIQFALDVVRMLWHKKGHDTVTVTSLADGQHSSGSLHYSLPTKAMDIRTRDLPGGSDGHEARNIAMLLGLMLPPLGFDVVFESDHIHIEYDPA